MLQTLTRQDQHESEKQECFALMIERARTRQSPEHVLYKLADKLKEEITDSAPAADGMWSDLIGSALAEVNWQEIAKAILEGIDFDPEAKDEEEESEDTVKAEE
jgi:hypothetical protein